MDTFQCNIVHTGKDACINARAVKPPDVGNSYCDMKSFNKAHHSHEHLSLNGNTGHTIRKLTFKMINDG